MRNTLKIGLVLFVAMGLMPLATAHTCTKWSVGVDLAHHTAKTCVSDPAVGTLCVGRPHACIPHVVINPQINVVEGLLA